MLFALGAFGVFANWVGVWSWLFPGPPAATPPQVAEVGTRVDGVQQGVDDIEAMLAGEYALNPERLEAEYPLGHALFFAERRGVEKSEVWEREAG